ncbi:MAG: hypothetical protein ISS95_00330 [Candidatus Aenigmarchaeota archaeon]|nr:hypothetical protein [Candidatus Aenigmarchaeota archaeon]
MKIQKIKEGKINLYIPKEKLYSQPVFYNPAAELNRDISVCAVQTFQKLSKRKIDILDALSASGISGLRYKKEVRGVKSVTLNDKNPSSIKLIKKNIKLNKLKNCFPSNKDANLVMRENVFNVIDLDPFGSPSIFLDSAARSVYHKGFLCVTATDQSALCGAYPSSCFRKYGIKSIKTDFYNELGVRTLISYIILSVARYEKAFVPLLSISTKHYYRVFGKIEHLGKISPLLSQFHPVKHKNKTSSPIYHGKIQDKTFCKSVLEEIKKRKFKFQKQEQKLLSLIIQEADLPAFYFDLHKLASSKKTSIPKTEIILKKLKKKKFKSSRTHFCPTAIKTNADKEEIIKILAK